MSRMFRRALAGVLAMLVAGSTAAQAQLLSGTKLYVGALNCNVSGSISFIFGSTKDLNCVLIRPDGTAETYSGKINRYGIDVGFTKAMHVVWHVYSITENAPKGALAG